MSPSFCCVECHAASLLCLLDLVVRFINTLTFSSCTQRQNMGFDAPICQDTPSGGLDVLLTTAEVGHDSLVDLSREEAFQAADDVAFGPASDDAPNYFPDFADALAEPDTLLQLSLSDQPGADLQDKKHRLVGSRRWVPGKGKPCQFVKRGVIVHGGPLQILDVCIDKKCGKHHPKLASTLSGGSEDGTAKEAQQYREVVFQFEEKEREWNRQCHNAISAEIMRVALIHVPTDAVTPAFGRLLLKTLPIRNLRADTSKLIKLPENEHGGIDFPELTDAQVTTAIVMSLTQDAIGWYAAYEKPQDCFAEGVTLLTALGVKDPTSVIVDAAAAYAAANPKPKKPRKPTARKKALARPLGLKGRKSTAKAAKPTPASELGK